MVLSYLGIYLFYDQKKKISLRLHILAWFDNNLKKIPIKKNAYG